MERVTIQIAAIGNGNQAGEVFSLANDGTIWRMGGVGLGNSKWELLPALPQPGEKPSARNIGSW